MNKPVVKVDICDVHGQIDDAKPEQIEQRNTHARRSILRRALEIRDTEQRRMRDASSLHRAPVSPSSSGH